MATEDLQPDLNTLRVFEDEGGEFRIYLTIGGAIACERFHPDKEEWVPIPMHVVAEGEIRSILAKRSTSGDEEIARAVAAHSKPKT